MNHIPMSQVTISGTSCVVFKNMITASANIARKAQCSRYLYFANVHFLTSMMVRLLTNIAHTPSPSAMMKIFLLKANAPITPSNEKLASNTSRYKNKESQTLATLVIVCFRLFNKFVRPSMRVYTMSPRIPASKNPNTSVEERNLATKSKMSKQMMISMASNCHIFLRNLSIGPIRWFSFSVSKKNFRATISKNTHPKPAITTLAEARMVA